MTEGEFLKAAFAGNNEEVETYLAFGGNIDVTAKNGMTALMAAIWNGGRIDTVRLLLKHAPDLTIRQPTSDWRAMTFAAVNGHADILQILFDHGDRIEAQDWKALAFAVQYRNIGTVEILLRNGADINGRDDRGRTPLMRAAANSDTPMLALLLEHGAETDLTDESGKTALIHAAAKANVENVRLLLRHGADTNILDAAGESALDTAIGRRRTKIIELLSNPRQVVNEGSLPAMASSHSSIE